jgi:hypothetical protein
VLAHSSSSSHLLLSIATMPSSSLCLGTLAYSTTLTVTNYQSYKEIHSQLVMLFLNKLRKEELSTFQILKKDNEKKLVYLYLVIETSLTSIFIQALSSYFTKRQLCLHC